MHKSNKLRKKQKQTELEMRKSFRVLLITLTNKGGAAFVWRKQKTEVKINKGEKIEKFSRSICPGTAVGGVDRPKRL